MWISGLSVAWRVTARPAIVSWGPASPSHHVTDWREHILVINVRTARNKAWRLFAIIDWIQSALWAAPDLLVHTKPVDLCRRNLLGELAWSHQMTHFQECLKGAVVNDYKCHPIFRSPQISLVRVRSLLREVSESEEILSYQVVASPFSEEFFPSVRSTLQAGTTHS